MTYAKKHLDSYFFKTPGFYVLNIPVKVPYTEIYGRAKAAGLKLKQDGGPILEVGRLFGSGWIGVEVEKPSQAREDVIHIAGDFEMALHKGAYKTIGKTCRQVSKDRPNVSERYNLYLDDPRTTAPENCRTEILFR